VLAFTGAGLRKGPVKFFPETAEPEARAWLAQWARRAFTPTAWRRWGRLLLAAMAQVYDWRFRCGSDRRRTDRYLWGKCKTFKPALANFPCN